MDIRLMGVLLCLVFGFSKAEKTKRQIYREQVLPYTGGKVPEDAFRADRLALNRLNKEGIAVPDGVLLEHRHVYTHPHSVRHDPEDENHIIRVIQQSENRFVPEEGRYQNENHLTVASTYLIRKPIEAAQTNIRTPDEQRPLHQFLNYKQHGNLPPFQPHPLPKHRQPPAPPPPPRYSTNERPSYPSFIYHPIPAYFELPNKEIQHDRYLSKNNPVSDPQDVPNKVDFSYHSDNYDRLSIDVNSLLQEDYDFGPTDFGLYESPEIFSPYSENFGFFHGNRFLRKTPEGFAKGGKRQELKRKFKSVKSQEPIE